MFDVSDVMRTVLLSTIGRRDLQFGDSKIHCDKSGVYFSNPAFPFMTWEDFNAKSVMRHMDMFHHIYNMPCALLIGMEKYYEELLLNRERDIQLIRGTYCPDISKIEFKYSGRDFVATAYRDKAMVDLLCINQPLIPSLPALSDPRVRLARLNIYDGRLQVRPYREGDGMVVIYRTSHGIPNHDYKFMYELLGLAAYVPEGELEYKSYNADIPRSTLESCDVKHKHVFAIIGDDRSKEERYTTIIEALSAMCPTAPDKLDALLAAMGKEDV